jgi:UDP-N-acetylglucosamine 1-carboxyvinyltransferase
MRPHNVPRIGDVEVMARLLLDIGAEVEGIGTTTLRIRAPKITTDSPDRSLVGRLRGSVLLLGPLLARCGKAQIAPPGRRLSRATDDRDSHGSAASARCA